MRIALAVTGSIAAYKAVEVARLFIKAGHTVVPMMTASAQRFVGPVTLSGICGRAVAIDMWDASFSGELHVVIADQVDAMVIVPATADMLARLAQGRGDDLITATVLCAKTPVFVAPAMHPRMWSHPATQANLATLRAHGRTRFIGPVEGLVASGDSGMGRMAEPADIVAAVLGTRASSAAAAASTAASSSATHSGAAAVAHSGPAPAPFVSSAASSSAPTSASHHGSSASAASSSSAASSVSTSAPSSSSTSASSREHAPAEPLVVAASGAAAVLAALASAGDERLASRHIVVTAGPTYEAIDPVRFIGNRSSGKMGFAIAAAARARGARVTLITGPVALVTPSGVHRVDVESADQMRAALATALGDAADALVMSAAVADFRPTTPSTEKIKKGQGTEAPTIALTKNPDLLAEIGAARTTARPILVGFALETGNDAAVIAYAKDKLTRKRVDLIVANAAHDSLGHTNNRVSFVDASGASPFLAASKDRIADELIDRLATRLTGSR